MHSGQSQLDSESRVSQTPDEMLKRPMPTTLHGSCMEPSCSGKTARGDPGAAGSEHLTSASAGNGMTIVNVKLLNEHF